MNKAGFYLHEINPARLAHALPALLHDAGFAVLGETHHHGTEYNAAYIIDCGFVVAHSDPQEKRTYIEITAASGAPFSRFIELLEAEYELGVDSATTAG